MSTLPHTLWQLKKINWEKLKTFQGQDAKPFNDCSNILPVNINKCGSSWPCGRCGEGGGDCWSQGYSLALQVKSFSCVLPFQENNLAIFSCLKHASCFSKNKFKPFYNIFLFLPPIWTRPNGPDRSASWILDLVDQVGGLRSDGESWGGRGWLMGARGAPWSWLCNLREGFF